MITPISSFMPRVIARVPTLAVFAVWLLVALVIAPPPGHAQTTDDISKLNRKVAQLNGDGKRAKAIAAAQALVEATKADLAKDHSKHIAALYTLADLLFSDGKMGEAISLYVRAVEIRKQYLGPSNELIAISQLRLGALLYELKRIEESEAQFRELTQQRKKQRGDRYDDQLIWMMEAIADDLERQQKYEQALILRQKIVHFVEREFGADNLSLANNLGWVAWVLNRLGRYGESELLRRRALAIREKKLGPNHRLVGKALNSLGWVLEAQGKSDEALVVRRRCLAIRLKLHGPDHVDVAEMHSDISSTLSSLGRFAEAETAMRKALAILERKYGPDSIELRWELSHLAYLLREQARYEEGEQVARRAIAIAEKTHGRVHSEVAGAIGQLAAMLASRSRFKEALKYRYEAVSILEKVRGPDHDDVGSALTNLGWASSSMGLFKEAETQLRKALKIRKDFLGADNPKLAYINENLSYTLRRQGRFRDAERFARRGLEIREAALGPENLWTGWSLHELANTLEGQYREKESIPLLQRGLEIMERQVGNDNPDYAKFARSLGLSLRGAARYAESEKYYRIALNIYEAHHGNGHNDVADTLESLANVLKAQNRYEESEKIYLRALDIYDAIFGKDHIESVNAVSGLGNIYYQQSRYELAEKHHRWALAIRQKKFGKDSALVAGTLSDLADILRHTKRIDEAASLARRSIEITEEHYGRESARLPGRLTTLARILETQNRYGEAVPLYKRALEIRQKTYGAKHPYLAWTHNRLGLRAEASESWQEALAHYRTAAEIVASSTLKTKAEFVSKDDHANRTRYVFRNLVDAAWGLAGEKPDQFDALMREAFAAAQWNLRTETGAAMSQLGARLAAGDTSLSTLVRQLQDLKARWQAIESKRVAAAGRAGREFDKTLSAEISNQLRTIEEDINSVQHRMVERYPQYAELTVGEPVSIETVQTSLSNDEMLLFFMNTDRDTLLWQVSRDVANWLHIPLSGRYSISEKVAALRRGLDPTSGARGAEALGGVNVGDASFDLAVAHELFTVFLGPVADDIKDKKHLIVIPPGPMTSLPLHVLVTEEPDASHQGVEVFRKAAWLARNHAVTILPSVSSLQTLRRNGSDGRAQQPYIGFGDPVLEGPRGEIKVASANRGVSNYFRGALADVDEVKKLAPLPDTADELKGIARSLGVAESEIILGKDATETRVKRLPLEKYRIVHFATHGLVAGDLRHLAEPALVLTPPNTATKDDDGLLTASEVTQLKLNADWVILSACNTAAGDNGNAEALSGLARAFFYAGAKTLLVSHWPVYSDAAVKLTTRAFSELKAHPEIGRAEALRRAMLDIIDKGDPREAHPSYWAPFVVVGEGAAM